MSCTPISYSRSSPGGKVVGEAVHMNDYLTYGEVTMSDTVQEQKETDSK